MIIIIILIPYLLCPFYKYPEIVSFAGKMIYNPYENISSNNWLKANFHAHTRQWTGITAGSSSHEEVVASKYKELKYDITGISDYQSINTYLEDDPLYIPVYEHGLGVLKSHQLVIGPKEVSWKEFMLFQTFHNKQDVINSLRKDGEVISINHPKLRGAYSPDDLKYLKDYDLLEVSSHSYFNAADMWDTALSAGNPVFVIANDDNHDINDPEDFGYVYTMINTNKKDTKAILSALKSGNAFGVELEPQKDTSPQKKIQQSVSIPVVTSCKIFKDTLEMIFNRDFDNIKIIGQNGKLKLSGHNNDTIKYCLQSEDTYIRAEINQSDMTNIFLNPVFRYDGEIYKVHPEIDVKKTWIFRFIYLIIALLVFLIIKSSGRGKIKLQEP